MIIGIVRKNSKNNNKRKSEYVCEINNKEEFQEIARNLLANSGYMLVKRNNEYVWEKKVFGASIYTYIQITYSDNRAHITGWMVGGFGEQTNLDGMLGVVYKIPAKALIKNIIRKGGKTENI